jgi:trehalose 6-phosphate synthase/phosphatase
MGNGNGRRKKPTTGWLLACDFDGTLAPLVDDPKSSTMTRAARAAVEQLHALAQEAPVRLAFISGRDLSDLAERTVAPDGTFLVGSHGAEAGRATTTGVEQVPFHLTTVQSGQLDALVAGFESAVSGREGAWVQVKPAAAVVHTRLASVDDAAAITVAADEVAANLGLPAMHGKDVVEVSVVPTSKGEALRRLRGTVAAELGVEKVRVLYAGDDTTDEHAFGALESGDLSIKVGTGDTLASHRVPDPDALAAVLAGLARTLRSND